MLVFFFVFSCHALLGPTQPTPRRHAVATNNAEVQSPVNAEEHNPVKRLLAAMEFLGPMRFITVGATAILEAVAEVEAVSYKSMPDGTTMATLKTDDASFEAHLRLDHLDKVTMDATPKGDRTLYAIRFVSSLGDKSPALVCLLHADQGDDYDPSTIEYWEGLCHKFGPELVL